MDICRQIEQSKFGVHVGYDFGADRVTYTLRDTSGERSFSVSYENVALRNTSSFTFNNNILSWRLRFIPAVTFLLGWFADNSAPDLGNSVRIVSILGFVALLICDFAKVFAVRFKLIPLIPSPPEAHGHSLRIIDNRVGSTIFDELAQRWKVRMKFLHGTANTAGDPRNEVARLTWLKENAILTDKEFAIEVAKIDLGSPETLDSSITRLN